MAEHLGKDEVQSLRREEREAQALCLGNVLLSLRGEAAHRTLVQLRPHRFLRTIQADAGLQRLSAHGLRCLWPARRKLCHQDGRPPQGLHREEHRDDGGPAPRDGRHV